MARLFNVIDGFDRESITAEIDFYLLTERVISALNQLIDWQDEPCYIRCGNGLKQLFAIRWR